MKNAITLTKARAIQAALAERGHRIDLELLTDCATIPEEDEEPEFLSLSPAMTTDNGSKIPHSQRRIAAAALLHELFHGALKHIGTDEPLLDASSEIGYDALCNGYATHGAIDHTAIRFLWVFLPLAPETT